MESTHPLTEYGLLPVGHKLFTAQTRQPGSFALFRSGFVTIYVLAHSVIHIKEGLTSIAIGLTIPFGSSHELFGFS